MNKGTAMAIFLQIDSDKFTDEEKAEAIEEFADRLEKRLAINTDITNFEYQSVIGDISNLVKEMVGDAE